MSTKNPTQKNTNAMTFFLISLLTASIHFYKLFHPKKIQLFFDEKNKCGDKVGKHHNETRTACSKTGTGNQKGKKAGKYTVKHFADMCFRYGSTTRQEKKCGEKSSAGKKCQQNITLAVVTPQNGRSIEFNQNTVYTQKK